MTLTNLPEKIKQLQLDRQKHAEAIAAIDKALQRVSEALGGLKESGGQAIPEALRLDLASDQLRFVRRKGKFAQTAEVSVMELIRRTGTPTTAQINAHWRNEGRCGTANVTILKLLQQGLIKRIADPTVRGSRYMLTESAPASESTEAAAVADNNN
jgi:hypothetical protein